MKTRHTVTGALLAIALTGCATLDRLPMSDFRPTSASSFEFVATKAREGGFYDEKGVMGWLETWLADNKMCGSGYEITGRQAVAMNQYVDRIYYTGRCT